MGENKRHKAGGTVSAQGQRERDRDILRQSVLPHAYHVKRCARAVGHRPTGRVALRLRNAKVANLNTAVDTSPFQRIPRPTEYVLRLDVLPNVEEHEGEQHETMLERQRA
jgi:hypothetical protein